MYVFLKTKKNKNQNTTKNQDKNQNSNPQIMLSNLNWAVYGHPDKH